MPDRVIVFIDAQNTYRSARHAFFNEQADPHMHGQFDPTALANLILSKSRRPDQRTLKEVRVYTGRPSAARDGKTYAAHMNQCAAWQAGGAVVIARPLRYPITWPLDKAREKGIDVRLAIDFVALASDDEYDVGVVFSVDTDLVPALEYVVLRLLPAKTVEVAAWRSPRARGRLSLPDKRVWCHWLDLAAYNAVADTRNYAA